MQIKELATISHVSVRTLHHYDNIGLLTPSTTSQAGYRIYSDENIEALQQILFYKELGFSLKSIKEIIQNPLFNRQEAMESHLKSLVEKKERMNSMIDTLEKSIAAMKGEKTMSNEDKFKGFEFNTKHYEEEAIERWGEKKVASTNKNWSQSNQDKFNAIYFKLAAIRHLKPDSNEAQEGIKEWYDYLNTVGDYSLESFNGLGLMYVEDERFKKNIDQFGEGLAQFMMKAMAVYSDRNKA